MTIPEFPKAQSQFRNFLRSQGHEGVFAWVFRDDLYMPTASRIVVRIPPPKTNMRLAKKVFSEGREKGLVEIIAVAQVGETIATSVWYPRDPTEEVQGWNQGVKLSLRQPFENADVVGNRFLWLAHQLLPSYRRFQKLYPFVGTREWAAA